MDTVVEHHGNPQDAETTISNPTPDAIPSSLQLPAGGVPDPGQQDVVSKHLLQGKDATWYQRSEGRGTTQEDRFYYLLQKVQAEWYQRYEEKNKEILAQSMQISELEAELSDVDIALRKLSDNFNLRGALERIVEHAKEQNKFKGKCPAGTQAALNELAATHAFKKILDGEIKARKLVEKDVKQCVALVYHECSKHAHGNTDMINIYRADNTPNESAALVTFMKFQGAWTGGLKWQEVAKGGDKLQGGGAEH